MNEFSPLFEKELSLSFGISLKTKKVEPLDCHIHLINIYIFFQIWLLIFNHLFHRLIFSKEKKLASIAHLQ